MTTDTEHTSVRNELDDAQFLYLQMLLDGGCKFLFRTLIFGKSYVWMKDKAGTIFLESIPEPQPTTFSVDGTTGEVTPIS